MQEEPVSSPSAQATDWRQGGALHLATKTLPGVSPYFSLVTFFAHSLRRGVYMLSQSTPPPVPVGVHGWVGPLRTLRPKFFQGFSPRLRILKNWTADASAGTPVDSLPPLCPYACVGGLGLSIPCGGKFSRDSTLFSNCAKFCVTLRGCDRPVGGCIRRWVL